MSHTPGDLSVVADLPDDDLLEPLEPIQRGDWLTHPTPPHSYSRLSTLLRCPREFWGLYIAGIPQPKTGPDPFLVGSRVHDGIEIGVVHVLETGQPEQFFDKAARHALAGMDLYLEERAAKRIVSHLTNLHRWLLQNNAWGRWAWGTIDVEMPFAIRADGSSAAWDGDRANKPLDAEICFIIDFLLRFPTGHALIIDWKTGVVRRRPLVDGVIDPQLLLYAYGLVNLDRSIHTIDVTFSNTGWDVPEPPIRLERGQVLRLGREWLDRVTKDMHRRDPANPQDWEPVPNKFCFFCAYKGDCPAALGERMADARTALAQMPASITRD